MAWYQGLVKTIMGEMRNVPNERKKEFGQVLNDFKIFVEEKYESLKANNAGVQTSNTVIRSIGACPEIPLL
jgi:phenylalanyl-tRNA synthetase alpha chain